MSRAIHECGWCARWLELRRAYEMGQKLEAHQAALQLIQIPPAAACKRHYWFRHYVIGMPGQEIPIGVVS